MPPTTQPAQPTSLPSAGLPIEAPPPLEPPFDMQITGSASDNLNARGLVGEPGSTIESTNAIEVVGYKPGLVDVVLHWNTTWGLPEGRSYNLAYEYFYRAFEVQGDAVQVKVNGNDVTNVPLH